MRIEKELINLKRRKRAIQAERMACTRTLRLGKLGTYKGMDKGQERGSLRPG